MTVTRLSTVAAPTPPRLSAALAALYPPGVYAAELVGSADPSLLTSRELQCVSHCAEKRIRDFAAGRSCARQVLGALGIEGFDLLAGEDRQPLWPAAVVGSITHTEGYCAAVAGPRSHFRGLGVDSEVVTAVNGEVWPLICVEAESRHLEELPPARRPLWAALVFAAKEAFYKSQFPLTAEWLEFTDLAIEPVDTGATEGIVSVLPQRRLELAAQVPGPWSGRFRFHGAFVTAAIAFCT